MRLRKEVIRCSMPPNIRYYKLTAMYICVMLTAILAILLRGDL